VGHSLGVDQACGATLGQHPGSKGFPMTFPALLHDLAIGIHRRMRRRDTARAMSQERP
jgi:hypothetical protein